MWQCLEKWGTTEWGKDILLALGELGPGMLLNILPYIGQVCNKELSGPKVHSAKVERHCFKHGRKGENSPVQSDENKIQAIGVATCTQDSSIKFPVGPLGEGVPETTLVQELPLCPLEVRNKQTCL